MEFKKTLLDTTKLPEDIIDEILKLKYDLESQNELNNFFLSCQKNGVSNTCNPLWCLNKLTSLHDLIYYIKYYYNDQKFLENITFKLDLIFVDSCDYFHFQENDEFFKHKTFTYKELLAILPLKFDYIYLNRICLTKDGYLNSCGYVANIKLEDPAYQKVFIKKHKKLKFLKKIFYIIKKKFNHHL